MHPAEPINGLFAPMAELSWPINLSKHNVVDADSLAQFTAYLHVSFDIGSSPTYNI